MRGIFDKESLRDWLRKKDLEEQYSYPDHCNCALAQYFRETTGNSVSVDSWSVTLPGGLERPLPEGWDKAAAEAPWTFGDMLKRLDGGQPVMVPAAVFDYIF